MSEPDIIVQKYGGSSVSSIEKLGQVAEHVASTRQQGNRVVVVVSAMGKTTDELFRMAHEISKVPSRRELDMLLSTGERISMALLAMALSERGIEAISLTGSQSGILTNDRHSGARIIEVRPIRVEDELAKNKVVIVAGFQGMSYKREITTLGRGGSDTTAVALAAALGAKACEIYSDVDGVYSADPHLIQNAKHLKEISYDEMQELAEHGAKVLNAQAVEWAKRMGVIIHARKTGRQNPSETKVVPIVKEKEWTSSLATAVTSSKQIVQLTSDRNGQDILALLESEGVSLLQSRLFQSGSSFGIETSFVKDDLPDFPRMRDRLLQLDGRIALDHSFGSVTVVGAGLGTKPSALSSATLWLAQHGIFAGQVISGPLSLCIFVPEAQVPLATQKLHDLFIKT